MLQLSNLRSRRADIRSERADFRPETANLKSRRADFVSGVSALPKYVVLEVERGAGQRP